MGLPALAAELAVVARKAGPRSTEAESNTSSFAIVPGQQTHWEGIAGNLKPLFHTSPKQQASSFARHATALERS